MINNENYLRESIEVIMDSLFGNVSFSNGTDTVGGKPPTTLRIFFSIKSEMYTLVLCCQQEDPAIGLMMRYKAKKRKANWIKGKIIDLWIDGLIAEFERWTR